MFDHSLEEISLEHNYAIIRAWIYSFHMPAFIFISGYFSKHVRKNGGVRKTIINCAIPYFIFNTIFVLWTEKTLAINILTPRYIFGDLFSLLIWRLLIDDLKGIRGILILSIILVQIPLHRITDSASNGSVFPVVTEHFSASSDHAFL